MTSGDNSLIRLRQRIAAQSQLEAKLQQLQDQRRKYESEVRALSISCREQQEDVQKLEGRSLANYVLQVLGRLDEKLDQERQQAYAAKVKLDAAERELAGIAQDIGTVQSQLAQVRVAQAQYQQELDQKRIAMKSSGTACGEQILELEQKIGILQAKRQEIREALLAGRSAKDTADKILSELNRADGWNAWDLVGGGGILTHAAKHGHLDAAQDLVQQLQSQLRRFKTELADIQIRADLQVGIDGFLRFADYFFDGLFADWAVGDRIAQSQNSVLQTKSQISQMLSQLSEMEAAAGRQCDFLRAQLEELVVQS